MSSADQEYAVAVDRRAAELLGSIEGVGSLCQRLCVHSPRDRAAPPECGAALSASFLQRVGHTAPPLAETGHGPARENSAGQGPGGGGGLGRLAPGTSPPAQNDKQGPGLGAASAELDVGRVARAAALRPLAPRARAQVSGARRAAEAGARDGALGDGDKRADRAAAGAAPHAAPRRRPRARPLLACHGRRDRA
eukprot:3929173-Rhodomonas_salina.2